MKLNVDIDEKHSETSITIQASEWTEEIEAIVNIIKKNKPERLFGIDEDQTVLLGPDEIDYVYAENRKIYANLKDRRVELKMKLYEIETILAPYHFARFSKSVIGNLNQIDRFELSFNGNLCVYFKTGNKEYVSRKYVNLIKEKLLMGGNEDGR